LPLHTFSQSRCHLVGKSSGDNHDIALSGRGTEHDTQSVLVIPRGGHVPACELRSYIVRHSRTHIISTAQHARPNVIGHIEPCRAQLTTLSRVDRTYSAGSATAAGVRVAGRARQGPQRPSLLLSLHLTCRSRSLRIFRLRHFFCWSISISLAR
jgi:hypothetical protein